MEKNKSVKFFVGVPLGLITLVIGLGITAFSVVLKIFRLFGGFTNIAFIILLIVAPLALILSVAAFCLYYTVSADGIEKIQFQKTGTKKWEDLQFEIKLYEKTGRVTIDFFVDENQPEETKLTFQMNKKFSAAIKEFAPEEVRREIETKYNYITSSDNFPE